MQLFTRNIYNLLFQHLKCFRSKEAPIQLAATQNIYFALPVESILFSISLLSVEDILEALLVRCAGCVLAVEPGLALPLLLGLGQLRDVAVVKPEHHHKILCILTWCQYLDLPSCW